MSVTTLSEEDVKAVAAYLVSHYKDQLRGKSGADGLPGKDGRIGPHGMGGPPGPRGANAHVTDICKELAANHGPAVSEACWPTLHTVHVASFVREHVKEKLDQHEIHQLELLKTLQTQINLLIARLEYGGILSPLEGEREQKASTFLEALATSEEKEQEQIRLKLRELFCRKNKVTKKRKNTRRNLLSYVT